MRALPGYLDAMFLGSAYYAPGGPGATAPAAVAYYATGRPATEQTLPASPSPVSSAGTPTVPDLVALATAHPFLLLGSVLALYWLVVKT